MRIAIGSLRREVKLAMKAPLAAHETQPAGYDVDGTPTGSEGPATDLLEANAVFEWYAADFGGQLLVAVEIDHRIVGEGQLAFVGTILLLRATMSRWLPALASRPSWPSSVM